MIKINFEEYFSVEGCFLSEELISKIRFVLIFKQNFALAPLNKIALED